MSDPLPPDALPPPVIQNGPFLSAEIVVIPQLGLSTDKGTLDITFGNIALSVRKVLTDIYSSKSRLDSLTDQDLKDRGYNDGQIAQLRSAWNDLNKFADVFYGRQPTDAYDFSTFVRFLWGFGV